MYPGAEPSDITVHVRMLEKTAEQQQDTLGILGVNLIYAAFYYFEDPRKIMDSLTDGLNPESIEVDSIEFLGPYFEDLDNRAMNLHLIRSWKTRGIMFKPDGHNRGAGGDAVQEERADNPWVLQTGNAAEC